MLDRLAHPLRLPPGSLLLETERLWLTPMPCGFTKELIAGRTVEAGAALGLAITPGWPEPELVKVLPACLAVITDPADGFGHWLFVEKREALLVGSGGFKGAPAEGNSIDLGYGIAPCCRGNGYATEASRALLEWALLQPGVNAVTADCLAANKPSMRTLQHLDMEELSRAKGMVYFIRRR